MDVPAEVSFKNLEKSDALDTLIRDRIERLERMRQHIVSCRVVVEAPHRAPDTAKVPLSVAVEVSLPGGKMVIGKEEQARHDSKTDATAFITRAFAQVERQLRD